MNGALVPMCTKSLFTDIGELECQSWTALVFNLQLSFITNIT
jgi:hypothetical protein